MSPRRLVWRRRESRGTNRRAVRPFVPYCVVPRPAPLARTGRTMRNDEACSDPPRPASTDARGVRNRSSRAPRQQPLSRSARSHPVSGNPSEQCARPAVRENLRPPMVESASARAAPPPYARGTRGRHKCAGSQTPPRLRAAQQVRIRDPGSGGLGDVRELSDARRCARLLTVIEIPSRRGAVRARVFATEAASLALLRSCGSAARDAGKPRRR